MVGQKLSRGTDQPLIHGTVAAPRVATLALAGAPGQVVEWHYPKGGPMNAPMMPALPTPLWQQTPTLPEEPVLPLTVEAYHALLKAGLIEDGDPVELLEGFLVRKMGKGPRHERARRQLRRLLEKLMSDEFFVDEQGALTTGDSEPEPDVFVIRGTPDDYADRHAGPTETVLIVEISDSSVRRDRNLKKRVYGRAGVAQYWVVNLVAECVEVYSQPTGRTKAPGYAGTATYLVGDQIPVVIDGKEVGQVAASAILGQPQPKDR
jgi:Uma2 family endonuclease